MAQEKGSVGVAEPGEDPDIILANVLRTVPSWKKARSSLEMVEI